MQLQWPTRDAQRSGPFRMRGRCFRFGPRGHNGSPVSPVTGKSSNGWVRHRAGLPLAQDAAFPLIYESWRRKAELQAGFLGLDRRRWGGFLECKARRAEVLSAAEAWQQEASTMCQEPEQKRPDHQAMPRRMTVPWLSGAEKHRVGALGPEGCIPPGTTPRGGEMGRREWRLGSAPQDSGTC